MYNNIKYINIMKHSLTNNLHNNIKTRHLTQRNNTQHQVTVIKQVALNKSILLLKIQK